MKIAYLIALTSILFSACHGDKMRTDERCDGDSRCGVSFFQVLGNPGIYDGKRILIGGYLAIYNNVLSLYPTEESYVCIDPYSSIGFRLPASKQKEIISSGLYRYVRVDGVVDMKSHGFDGDRLGDFIEINFVEPIRIIEDKDREQNFGVTVDLIDK